MNKCLVCGDNFNEPEDLYAHMDEEHADAIPKDFTAAQYNYYLKTGKSQGTCVVDKAPTTWNESTNKYHRFCDKPSCKEKYREEFKKRMIGKHGRVHLLNDPDQQRKMLANRSISGEYQWSDHKKIPYTGSYELDFLRFLDNFMNFDSQDIMSPSPHTYYYIYEGEEKFYIPDFFIPSLNLEIEIKDGGDNPNNHHKIQGVDKVKEKLKDAVMTSQKSFSYIKLVNKNYDPFFDFMMRKKREFEESGKTETPIFIVTESMEVDTENQEVVTESIGDISLREIENHRRYGSYNPTDEQKIKVDGDLYRDQRLRLQHQEQQLETELEEVMETLELMDNGLFIPEYHYETQTIVEGWGKDTRRVINRAYNYSDRFKIGFTVRNFDLIFSNMLKNAQKTGNFAGLRENLIELAGRCADINEVNYLRRDKNAGKAMLKKLAVNKPELAKQCHSHIKWLETEYTQVLNDKAKELRGQKVTESFQY